ncbi:MAG: hypothetical protein ACJAYU_002243 [Bradymonadia bacterium]|jgi:hypothetical protein
MTHYEPLRDHTCFEAHVVNVSFHTRLAGLAPYIGVLPPESKRDVCPHPGELGLPRMTRRTSA